jgi:hypothetical protein
VSVADDYIDSSFRDGPAQSPGQEPAIQAARRRRPSERLGKALWNVFSGLTSAMCKKNKQPLAAKKECGLPQSRAV